jgi:hypothetical protein
MRGFALLSDAFGAGQARGGAGLPKRLRGAHTAGAGQSDLERRRRVGPPGGVNRERTPAAGRPEPVADDLTADLERARGASFVGRPLPGRKQRPVRHSHGRHIEHGTEMQCQAGPARVIAARRVHQQHVREVRQRAHGGFKQRAFAQRE